MPVRLSAECGSSFLFSVISQNKYWLLASINTEKLCPSVVQCYPRAFGSRATLGHNFPVLTSASVNIFNISGHHKACDRQTGTYETCPVSAHIFIPPWPSVCQWQQHQQLHITQLRQQYATQVLCTQVVRLAVRFDAVCAYLVQWFQWQWYLSLSLKSLQRNTELRYLLDSHCSKVFSVGG